MPHRGRFYPSLRATGNAAHRSTVAAALLGQNLPHVTTMLRRIVPFALHALALAAAPPARAGLDLDLSYVDSGTPAYARFHDWVDQAYDGSPGYAFEAADAAYLARLDPVNELDPGDRDYCTLAVDLVEAQVVEAEGAIAGDERPPVAYDSYLEVGQRIRDLALAYDWCAGHLGAAQRDRWRAYAEQAVWNVWHPDDAAWGGNPFPWSGWSLDNPGNNYHYSFLEATMSWGLAREPVCAGCTDWVAFLEAEKVAPLVAYYASLPGGGSREGTGYGTAQKNLFELYRLWRDATGDDLSDDSTHAADTIDDWIHATVPTFDRFAPIGDQSRSSIPELYDYHRHLVLAARALAAPESDVARRATWWLRRISVDEMTSGFNLRHDLLPEGDVELAPETLVHHSPGAGHLFARTGWDRNAVWLAAVAGTYNESHAHQDQGSFTLFRGDWLAVTENIWTHSGIQQGTEVHNVVRFVAGGATEPQRECANTMSFEENAGSVEIAMELSDAYDGSSAVSSWTRNLTFAPDGTLTVLDEFAIANGVEAVWQLNLPVEPSIGADGTIRIRGLEIDPVAPAAPTIAVVDWSSVDDFEFQRGWKIELRGGATGYLVALHPALFWDDFESGGSAAWSAQTAE